MALAQSLLKSADQKHSTEVENIFGIRTFVLLMCCMAPERELSHNYKNLWETRTRTTGKPGTPNLA